jgi:hypothetical protein
VGGSLHTSGEIEENYKFSLSWKKKFTSTIIDLKEVTLLNSKLANMTKSIKMLNKGSNMLDVIVEISKKSGNVQGIEFDYSSMNKNVKRPNLQRHNPR